MKLATINKPLLTLDAAGIAELTLQYVKIVNQIALGANLHVADIFISSNAISLALAESAADLEIMALRRRPKGGVSPAKIAGIVAFRLARFAPINLIGSALENDTAQKLNELAALALVLKAIMHIDINKIASKHATSELQYTLVRRHTNQETLGLVFEILSEAM